MDKHIYIDFKNEHTTTKLIFNKVLIKQNKVI